VSNCKQLYGEMGIKRGSKISPQKKVYKVSKGVDYIVFSFSSISRMIAAKVGSLTMSVEILSQA